MKKTEDPIQSTTCPQNPDPIQSNPWMDPIHVQLWVSQFSSFSAVRIFQCLQCLKLRESSKIFIRREGTRHNRLAVAQEHVSGAENGSERDENRLERSGEWAKSAAQNPFHRRTTNVKILNRFLKLLRNCQCKLIISLFERYRSYNANDASARCRSIFSVALAWCSFVWLNY